MSNSLWVSAVKSGLAADKPTTPDIPAGTFAFYYETDNAKMTLWNGSAWVDLGAVVGTLASSSVKAPASTFANKPAAPVTGQLAYITDSNTHTIGATVAAGGTDKVLAVYNGANWIVGGVPAQV